MSDGPQQNAGLQGRTEEEVEYLKSLYVLGEESVAALARREGINHKTLQQHAYRHGWRQAREEHRKLLAQTRGQGVIEPLTAVQRINLEIARKVMQYFAEDLEFRLQNNTVYEFPFTFYKEISETLRESVKEWGSVMPLDEHRIKLVLQQFNQLNMDGSPHVGGGGKGTTPMDADGLKELMRTLANSIAGGNGKPPEIPAEVVPQDEVEQ